VALTLIREFVRRGFEVDLLLLRKEGPLLALLPREVNVVDLQAPQMRSAIFPLVRYLRRRRPRVIQVSMWPLTILAVLAQRLSGSRSHLVMSDHTTLSKHHAHLSPIGRGMMKTSIRILYPLADARVIVSNKAADDLAALAGITRSSISVIYNPIAAPEPDVSSSLEVEAAWGSGAARILTVGSLKEEKNHTLLIRAFARLTAHRTAKLIILGEGPMMGRLRAAALQEGVAEHVLLPGFVVDAWPFYRSADLFVLSSDYEGYPLVLIEAMLSGVQIVSTDCDSGPREILAGGQYGALVPCGDEAALAAAMEHRLENPLPRESLRERAEALSGTDAVEAYLRVMLPNDR
jgi:glycosyltransferase involved in cell wall biosynthesis